MPVSRIRWKRVEFDSGYYESQRLPILVLPSYTLERLGGGVEAHTTLHNAEAIINYINEALNEKEKDDKR